MLTRNLDRRYHTVGDTLPSLHARAVMSLQLFVKTPYRLMPHAYVCARDDYVVLMDSERGKYLAIDGRQSRELGELIEGWPNPTDDIPVWRRMANSSEMPDMLKPHHGSADRIVQQLLDRKLLTNDPTLGKTAASVKGPVAMRTFRIFGLDRSLRPYWRYLPIFIFACLRARWLYRNIRLAKVGARIRARRLKWGPLVQDVGKLERLVRAHHHLRPLIYTGRDKCLYDSMVLIEFLAAYRVDATWVFGVHTAPWLPHCWVRAGAYLLNDNPENIGRFSILAEF